MGNQWVCSLIISSKLYSFFIANKPFRSQQVIWLLRPLWLIFEVRSFIFFVKIHRIYDFQLFFVCVLWKAPSRMKAYEREGEWEKMWRFSVLFESKSIAQFLWQTNSIYSSNHSFCFRRFVHTAHWVIGNVLWAIKFVPIDTSMRRLIKCLFLMTHL